MALQRTTDSEIQDYNKFGNDRLGNPGLEQGGERQGGNSRTTTGWEIEHYDRVGIPGLRQKQRPASETNPVVAAADSSDLLVSVFLGFP